MQTRAEVIQLMNLGSKGLSGVEDRRSTMSARGLRRVRVLAADGHPLYRDA